MPATWFFDAAGAGNTAQTNSVDTSSTNAGAISLATACTLIVSAGAETRTLAQGVEGQVKLLRMKTDGGDVTLTITGNPAASDVLVFGDAGDTVLLYYTDSQWCILTNTTVTVG